MGRLTDRKEVKEKEREREREERECSLFLKKGERLNRGWRKNCHKKVLNVLTYLPTYQCDQMDIV